MSKLTTITVVGAGDMGHGIAEACALAGYRVHLRDIKQEFLDIALERIEKSLRILARKRKLKKEDVPGVLARIETFTDVHLACNTADIVVEAVPEIMALKQQVLREIDDNLPPGSIIATNTSNMSITTLANSTKRSAMVAGLHFFNPAIVMKTVEVIPGENTADSTVEKLNEFVKTLGKIPIHVLKDSPGFIVNRILVAAQVLTTRAVEQGIFTPNQLDAIAKKMSMPMGPFETMDFVGLDVVIHGMRYFGSTLGEEYAPPDWLVNLFDNGNLGKKTGRGIFDWSVGRPQINLDDSTEEISLLDLMAVQVNEATKLLEEGVVEDPQVVDLAIKNGTGNAMGILALLKSVGSDQIIQICDRWSEKVGLQVFIPTKTLREWQ